MREFVEIHPRVRYENHPDLVEGKGRVVRWIVEGGILVFLAYYLLVPMLEEGWLLPLGLAAGYGLLRVGIHFANRMQLEEEMKPVEREGVVEFYDDRLEIVLEEEELPKDTLFEVHIVVPYDRLPHRGIFYHEGLGMFLMPRKSMTRIVLLDEFGEAYEMKVRKDIHWMMDAKEGTVLQEKIAARRILTEQ